MGKAIDAYTPRLLDWIPRRWATRDVAADIRGVIEVQRIGRKLPEPSSLTSQMTDHGFISLANVLSQLFGLTQINRTV